MELLITETGLPNTATTNKTQKQIDSILKKYNIKNLKIVKDKDFIDIVSDDYLGNWDVRNIIKAIQKIINDGEYYFAIKDVCLDSQLFDFTTYKITKNKIFLVIYGIIKEIELNTK